MTIIVSAPGSGIGKTLVPYLLDQGYTVIGLGRENSRRFAISLQQEGKNIEFFDCSYRSEESVENVFRQLKQNNDSIDGFIHLVGGSLLSKNIDELTHQDFRRVVEVNLDSTFLLAREAYKWMKDTGGGNIIFFGSTTGIEPSAKKMVYGVAKAAVHNMTLSFALEGSQYGVITNTIAPSYVMTPRHVNDIEEKAKVEGISTEDVLQPLKEKNPLSGILDPEDILPLVDLLIKTRKIQGQVIRIDLGQVGI